MTRHRFFRVPNPGLYTTVLVGTSVKEAWEKAGLRGWHLEPAIVHED